MTTKHRRWSSHRRRTCGTYNNRGRKSSTKNGVTTNYTYNALGQLIKKGSSSLYYYDAEAHILGIYTSTGAPTEEIVWLGDIPLATLRPKAGGGVDVYYIHSDHLNTPRLITAPSNNSVRWKWDAEPFGGGAPDEDPSGAGSFAFQLRFPGQLYFAETGLHYNYYRDCDPSTGRYVQSDPIGLRGGFNTFGYAGSNPIDTSDASGLAKGPRGGWVECERGKLVPRYAKDRPAYYWRCGLIDCVLVHERTHIFDMNATGQDGQCRFLPPGVEARMIGSDQ